MQHHVVVALGPSSIERCAGAQLEKRGIDRRSPARWHCARAPARGCLHVVERGHDLLDPGGNDVGARQSVREITIAFNWSRCTHGAGLPPPGSSPRVMPTSGAQELLAQTPSRASLTRAVDLGLSLQSEPVLLDGARGTDHRSRSLVLWIAGAMMWLGGSSRQLNDVLAEIRLDRVRVRPPPCASLSADFLGHHRLALGNAALCARIAAQVDDDLDKPPPR